MFATSLDVYLLLGDIVSNETDLETANGKPAVLLNLFRQPDSQIGFLLFGTTMGQLLSLPMFLAGAWLIIAAKPLGKPAA